MISFFKNLLSSSASNKEEKQKEEKTELSPVLSEESEDSAAPERGAQPRRRRMGGRQPREMHSERREGGRFGRGSRRNGRRIRPDNPPDEHPEKEIVPPTPEEEAALLENLRQFALYVAQSLVDAPEQVTAELVKKEAANVIMISCEKKDTGKIIGKNGRIIASIRTLVSGAAGKSGLHATVDILD